MESTHYLPDEVVNFVNYPELQKYKSDIERILVYGVTVSQALDNFNNGLADKIDINLDELNVYIADCRNLCEELGTVNKVCFDILLNLRKVQEGMQTVAYLGRIASQYIGTPTKTGGEV